jgi:hypothetical protein
MGDGLKQRRDLRNRAAQPDFRLIGLAHGESVLRRGLKWFLHLKGESLLQLFAPALSSFSLTRAFAILAINV